MSDFFWFSDAQWARIGPLLPTDTRGMARVDDRRVLSGIVHALRNGGRWADCPREVYGPKKTLYNRFVRWAERGIWERIFSALAGVEDAPDRLFIDSTCIKVHRCAGGFGKAHTSSLGPWHRPHQGGPQHQAPRCLRCERQAPRGLLLTPGNVLNARSPTTMTSKPWRCFAGINDDQLVLPGRKGFGKRPARHILAERVHGRHPPRKRRLVQYHI